MNKPYSVKSSMRGLTTVTVIIFSAAEVVVVITKVVAPMNSSSKSVATMEGSRYTHWQ